MAEAYPYCQGNPVRIYEGEKFIYPEDKKIEDDINKIDMLS